MKRYVTILIPLIFFASCNKKVDNPDVQWKKQNTQMINIYLTKVFFSDPNTGYVAGESPTDYTIGFYQDIVNIDSFTEMIKQPQPINDPKTFNFLKLDSSTLTEPEPSLFVTNDAGNSWNAAKVPFVTSVIDINFVDKLNGFVVTKGEGVYKTEDGGINWYRILGNVIFPGDDIISLNPYTNVYFIDKMNGFVFNKNGLLIATHDGGDNWDYISSIYDTSMYLFHQGIKKIVFPEKKQTGFLLSFGHSIYKTTDGGKTWYRILETTEWIEDVSFLTEKTGVYLTDGHIYKTTDGGETWKTLNYDNRASILENDQIAFPDSTNLYVLNNDLKSIFYSNDGGNSFIKMSGSTDLFNPTLQDIFFTGSGMGIVVGCNGSIFSYNP